MNIVTGHDRFGSGTYDGSRSGRRIKDRTTASDIEFSESEKELMSFGWKIIPQTFEQVKMNSQNTPVYVCSLGYQYVVTQTVQRQFNAGNATNLAKGFVDSSPWLLDPPSFPIPSGSGSSSSESGEWLINSSSLVVDPETGEVNRMVVNLISSSIMRYVSGESGIRYTFPPLYQIEEMTEDAT